MYRICLIFISLFWFELSSQEVDLAQLIQNDQLKNLPNNQTDSIENRTLDAEDSLERESNSRRFVEIKEKSKIFGYDFFNYRSKTSTPFLDIPLQGSYRVSLNDEVEILLTGVERRLIKSRVDLSGSLLIPQFGVLNIAGNTLEVAQQKVNQLISSISPGTKAFLSITKPSARKVSVVGMVKEPGTYQVNPYTTVSEAIKYSSGLIDQASLRSIELVRVDGSKLMVDLYGFLVFGERDNDISLDNGDSIVVKSTTRLFDLSGHVVNEGVYEYLPSDSYEDLISFAQGYKKEANQEVLYANLLENGAVKTIVVNPKDMIGNINLVSVFVSNYTSIEEKLVKVYGSSVTSGFHDPAKYNNLFQLFNELNFSSDVYPFIFMYKKNKADLIETVTYGINPTDKEYMENIKLDLNDELRFFSVDEIFEFNEIFNEEEKKKIEEEQQEFEAEERKRLFVKTGNIDMLQMQQSSGQSNQIMLQDYPYFKEEEIAEIPDEIRYFINSFALNVKTADGEIVRLPVGGNFDVSKILKFLNKVKITDNESLISVFDVNSGVQKNVEEEYLIESAKDVVININPVTNTQIKVKIEGLVEYPGEYLVDNSTSLSDLYEIAGGFKDRAFYKGIIFRRESIANSERISAELNRNNIIEEIISSYSNSAGTGSSTPIDPGLLELFSDVSEIEYLGRLAGDFSPELEKTKTLYLENGDSIYVPAFSNTIRISGQVNQPISINFDNTLNLEDYIDLAGGFANSADKKLIFIITAGGEGKVVPQRRLFNESNIFLQPGDTIFIPRDIGKLDSVSLARVSLEILSSLAISAASLNAISN